MRAQPSRSSARAKAMRARSISATSSSRTCSCSCSICARIQSSPRASPPAGSSSTAGSTKSRRATCTAGTSRPSVSTLSRSATGRCSPTRRSRPVEARRAPMPRIDISNLRGDLFGGITAGIVALPLALALGVASGMGPIAGLYGAIFVGFFAALFGGTPAQISGPTGPMVVVLAGVAASLPGRPDLVFTAVMLAGLFQIGFGVLRLGEYIRLVPYPVVSGFMSGTGVLIVLLQVGRPLGSEPPGDTVSALVHIAHALSEVDRGASTVGVLTVAVAFCWPKGFAKYLPAPLAALIAGTIAGLFVNAPVLGDIPSGLPRLQMPVFDREAMLLVLEVAIVLAALGAIDSLL